MELSTVRGRLKMSEDDKQCAICYNHMSEDYTTATGSGEQICDGCAEAIFWNYLAKRVRENG